MIYNTGMAQLRGYKINNEFLDNPVDFGGIRLIRAGRYYCEPGAVVPYFSHDDFFELTIVNDGSGIILTNGKRIPVRQNEIYVSFPFDKHGIISSESDPIQYDHLAFVIENDEYLKAMNEIVAEYGDPFCRIISDRRINYLTYCVISEFNKEESFYKDVVRYAIYNIIIYIIRKFNEKNLTFFSENVSDGEIFCNRLMSYIDANVYEIEKLSDLTKITNYNYSYLSQLFKKTTGGTLRDYYLSRKLEEADSLVKEGKLKICQIAEKLHYSAPDAFTKAYKKKYGVPPKDNKNE